MANWARNIARSAVEEVQKETLEDLFVFGYQCKLFRDDEKAQYLDEGRHLIPWMGDSSLMIDRYDGRGHLFDISPYDADLHKRALQEELSEAEAAIERACEEERYLELHTDIMEQATFEEEDIKRLNEGNPDSYAAIGFNYDNPSAESEEDEETPQQLEEEVKLEVEEPYVPPPELKVPEGMHMPPSEKMNTILEKTAEFIANHGTQMEIVIKAKQANNPQFDFLNFSHYLNPFYKHVVKMIKSGKYKPVPQNLKLRPKDSFSQHGNSEHYEEEIDSKNFLKSVQDKLPAGQIANTAYAKLVSRMSQYTGRNSPDPSTLNRYLNNSHATTTGAPYNTDGSAANVASSAYRRTLPQASVPTPSYVSSSTTTTLATSRSYSAPDRGYSDSKRGYEGTNPEHSAYREGYDANFDGYPEGGYSEDYNNDGYNYYGTEGHYENYEESHYDGESIPSANASNTAAPTKTTYPTQSYPPTSGANLPPPPGEEPVTLPSTQPPPPGTVSPEPVTRAGPNGNFQQQGNGDGSRIITPPPDMLPIIDKMAAYVAKNGPDFELVVKSKQDARFNFLYSWHPHYAYYCDKKAFFEQQEGKDELQQEQILLQAAQPQRQGKSEAMLDTLNDEEAGDGDQLSKAAKAAVSFSIKIKSKEKESPKSCLKKPKPILYESSEEEGEEEGMQQEDEGTETSGQSTPKMASTPAISAPSTPTPIEPLPVVIKQEKPAVSAEDMEKKLAEEQLKNKLASAAREKLAQSSKEKQMQAERKRRAAMFISMLKAKPHTAANTPTTTDSVATVKQEPAEDVKPIISSTLSSPKSVAVPTGSMSQKSLPVNLLAATTVLARDRSKSGDRRSRSRSRHRSRSPRKRSRSRSPRHKRRKSPPHPLPVQRRSRSPKRKRSRSMSPSKTKKHRRSRSKSRSKKLKKRSRSRSKSKSKKSKDKKRSRSRSRSKSRKSKDKRRSRSRSRSKSRKSKKKARSRSRSTSKAIEVETPSDGRSRSQSKTPAPHAEDFIKTECSDDVQIIEDDTSAIILSPIKEEETKEVSQDSSPSISSSEENDPAVQPKPELLEKVRMMLKASRTT